MIQKLDELFLSQIEQTKISAKRKDVWLPGISKFYKVKELSIDERGRNGQEFLQNVFKLMGYRTQGDNEKTGEWDIKINNWRVEVKTACLDRSGKFQHESLHKTNNYDFVFFLDIAPDNIYFAVTKYKDIPFDIIHERGNETQRTKRTTGVGFKYDFTYKTGDKKIPKYHGIVNTVEDMKNIFEHCLNEH